MLTLPTPSSSPQILSPNAHFLDDEQAHSLICTPFPPAPAPGVLFNRLCRVLRDAGAVISSKVERFNEPPPGAPGMRARADIAALEQLVRIPADLQVSHDLVQRLAPQLVAKATQSAEEQWLECPDVVTFVAQKLHELEQWELPKEAGDDAWSSASWLDLLFGMQLGNDFSSMPHLRLPGSSIARQLLHPSPEVHNAEWNCTAYRHAFMGILRSVDAETLGTRFEINRFVQAHLILLTRTFSSSGFSGNRAGHFLVPIADMFNHSHAPNSAWSFVDDGSFVLRATEKIKAGQEMFISYGREKSNVRLFRTYGFTLHSRLEPTWSFRVWPSQAHEVFKIFLPRSCRKTVLDLETCRVDCSTQKALTACVANGTDPAQFLSSLCIQFRKQYHEDPILQPALEALRQIREVDPNCASWWAQIGAKASSDANECDISKAIVPKQALKPHMVSDCNPYVSEDVDCIQQCALRVKMSEYLCLLAHIEALDLLADRKDPDKCLERAKTLKSHICEAFSKAGHRAFVTHCNEQSSSIPQSTNQTPNTDSGEQGGTAQNV